MINDIYFKFELSYILVPVLGLLYIYCPIIRPYFIYVLIYIALIGTYNTILVRKEILKTKYGKYQYWLAIIFHLILLLSLLEFKKFGYPNIGSLIIMLIGILIINYLPYWPYYLSRDEMTNFYIVLYVILSFIYYIIKYIN